VAELAKLLAAPEPARRRAAAEALAGASGATRTVLAELEKAAGDEDAGVRRAAARAAFQGGSRAAAVVAALVDGLKAEDLPPRREVAMTVSGFWPLPDELLTALKAALDDREGMVRVAAAGALARSDDTAAAAGEVLAAAVKDRRLTYQAVNALAMPGLKPAALKAAAPALREVVKHPPQPQAAYVASRAALALARAEGEGAVGLIVEALTGPEPRLPVPAMAQALRECGPAGVAALRQLLSHKEPALRLTAAHQLGLEARQDASLVPDLAALLKDKDPYVRGRALIALGAAGPNAAPAAAAVADAFRDAHLPNRFEAALAVVHIGAPTGRGEALDVLRSALANRGGLYGSPPRALEAIGRLGADAAAAVPDILPHLTRPDTPAQVKAAEALGQIGRPAAAATAALTDLLKAADPAVKAHAAIALWRVTGQAEPVVPVLAMALPEPALRRPTSPPLLPQVQMPGMGSLGYRGPGPIYYSMSLPPTAFGEPVVLLVIRTLGDIGPVARPAAPALRAVQDDPDANVREAAAEALKKVEPDADTQR
jgi:HEAT repeat protein